MRRRPPCYPLGSPLVVLHRLQCPPGELVAPEELGERERRAFRLLACMAERAVAAHGSALLARDGLALGLLARAVVAAGDAVHAGHPTAGELVHMARDLGRDFWLDLRPPFLPDLPRA